MINTQAHCGVSHNAYVEAVSWYNDGMMLLGLLVGTAVVLAGLVYITKRHFGLPVMGLAVGVVLTQLWAADVMPYAAGVGIGIDRSALLAVVTIVLTMLPAMVLVCCGSVISQRWWRIGGSHKGRKTTQEKVEILLSERKSWACNSFSVCYIKRPSS